MTYPVLKQGWVKNLTNPHFSNHCPSSFSYILYKKTAFKKSQLLLKRPISKKILLRRGIYGLSSRLFWPVETYHLRLRSKGVWFFDQLNIGKKCRFKNAGFFVFILLLFFLQIGGEYHTKMHLFPEIDQDMDSYFLLKNLFGCLFIVIRLPETKK